MCLQDFPEQRFEWKNENQIGSFVIDAAGLNPNQHRCQHAAQPPYTPYTLHPTLILHPTPYTLHPTLSLGHDKTPNLDFIMCQGGMLNAWIGVVGQSHHESVTYQCRVHWERAVRAAARKDGVAHHPGQHDPVKL
jgi:hypothetical protein